MKCSLMTFFIPELVFEQDEDLQQKLTELMAKIDRVIVESLKGFE